MTSTRISLDQSTVYSCNVYRHFVPERHRSLNVKISDRRVTHASLNVETESLNTLEKSASSKSKEVMELAAKVLVGTYARTPVVFGSGKGCKLYDLEGREYLDLTAGIAVNALGHSDPDLVNAVINQANTLIHVSNIYHSVPQVKVISFLVFKLPFLVYMMLIILHYDTSLTTAGDVGQWLIHAVSQSGCSVFVSSNVLEVSY